MRRLSLTLLILVPLIVLLSWLAWFLTPSTPLDLLLIDKTMVDDRANEHRALAWLLTQERYVPREGSYAPGEQSVGFRPTGEGTYEVTGFETRDSLACEELAATYDAAYVADAYGIFEITWHQAYPELGPITQPSRKIYGGLHQQDMIVLRAMEREQKPIIAEFSCLEPPTPPDVREDMESLLGVRWTGWTGRFFATLDSTGDDLPAWIVRNFMRQSGGSWPFGDSPGIVLSHLDERIVILRYPEDLEYPTITVAATYDTRARLGAPEQPLPYPFWFDIVTPDTTAESLAYFTLPSTPLADTLLRAFQIPRIFPAVVERPGRNIFYFAGDFADYPDVNELLAHFKGMQSLRTMLYTNNDPSSRSEFYWTFYYPMVRSILRSSVQRH